MKLKHLALAILAAAGLSVSCNPEDIISVADINLATKTIEFTESAQSATVTFTATRDWTVSCDADWVVLSEVSGKASKEEQTVEVSVLANTGTDRATEVKFTIGLKDATVTVKQKGPAGEAVPGDGTLEHPYSASEANALASALESGATTPSAVYVHGFVKKFGSKHEDGIKSYGNASFYMTDDATFEGDDFYAYQVYAPGNKKFTSLDQINLGDEVIVYGKLTNYNGTAETEGKGAAYVYSINGNSEGGNDTPNPPAGEVKNVTVKEFQAAAVDANVYYRLTGTVGTGSINTTYGNFDLEDETGSVYVYGLSNISEVASKLVAGAKVVVVGTRGEYNGKIEMLNGKCEKIEEGETPEPPTVKDPKTVTVAEFNAAAVSTDQPYQLTGIVSGSINTNYGNFDLVDETGTVYVYGLTATNLGYGASNDKSYASLGIAAGDEVTLIGFRGEYNGKIEVMYAYHVSHKSNGGNTGDGGNGGNGGNTGGEQGTVSLEPSADEVLYLLSNEEIKAVCASGASGSVTYGQNPLPSAGGDWFGNFAISNANTFLQFRNNNASYLTSPQYSSEVVRVVVVAAEAKFKQSTAKDLRIFAVPVVDPATLPTGKDANKNNITYTDAQWQDNFGNCVIKSNGGAQTAQITFSKGGINKFSILSADGAMYLDAIYVFCKK